MTKDDIIIIGYEADAYANGEWDVEAPSRDWKRLRDEHFAALVAAAEREACAKLVEPDFEHRGFPSDYLGGEEGVELLDCIVAKIRARSRP
jgi:hypothetical protein